MTSDVDNAVMRSLAEDLPFGLINVYSGVGTTGFSLAFTDAIRGGAKLQLSRKEMGRPCRTTYRLRVDNAEGEILAESCTSPLTTWLDG